MDKKRLQLLRERFENELATRSATGVSNSYNKDTHSLRVVAASEAPCLRIDWERMEVVDEVLLAKGMHLPPGRTQIPLLDTHGRYSIDDIAGNAKDFTLVGEKQECTIQFSSVEKGVKAETLAAEGHLTDVSIGYMQEERMYVAKGEKAVVDGRTFEAKTRGMHIVTKTLLKELSVCPVGADSNAVIKSVRAESDLYEELRTMGMSESAGDEEALRFLKEIFTPGGESTGKQTTVTILSKGEHTMEENQLTPEEIIRYRSWEKSQKTEEQITAENNKRIEAIKAMGTKFEGRIDGGSEMMKKLVADAIELRVSPEFFASDVKMRITDTKPIDTTAMMLGLSQKEVKNYSISRAIHAMASRNASLAPDEMAMSDEIAKRTGKPAIGSKGELGFHLPADIAMNSYRVTQEMEMLRSKINATLQRHNHQLMQRDLTVGSATAGGNLVGTFHDGANFIELLRNKITAVKFGAKVLYGLRDNLRFPKQTAGSTFGYAASEQGGVAESNPTFGVLSMTPKIGGTYVDYSYQLLVQSNPAIDMLLGDDLALTGGIGLDHYYYHGAGTSGEPSGLAAISGTGSVDGTDFNIDCAVELITDLAGGNALADGIAWTANPLVWGRLRKRLLYGGAATPSAETIIDKDGLLMNYPGEMTNNVDDPYLFFGNHNYGIIGLWGDGFTILVDPYTGITAGNTRVRLLVAHDFGFRQPGAFVISSNVS